MARNSMPLGDFADVLLKNVEHGELEKSAASTYTSDKKTEIGEGLSKLAAELRSHAPRQITYADLTEFRKRYGI